MSEIELKFGVPEAAVAAVEASLRKWGAEALEIETVYWDTADGRLTAKHVALRLRCQQGAWEQTVKASGAHAVERLEETVPRDPPAADGQALHADPALHRGTEAGERLDRALGRHAADPEALRPVYRSRMRRQAIELEADGSVVELVFDQGTVEAGERTLPLCEVEVELKRGSASALIGFGRANVDAHGMWLSTIAKSARGERLARSVGGEALSSWAVKSRRVELQASMSGEAIFRALVAGALEQVLANASALAAGEGDAEGVHQLRIGLRRLRTIWRELADWRGGLGPEWEPVAAATFRTLGLHRDRETVASALESSLAAAGSPDPRLRPDAGSDVDDPIACVRAEPFQHALLDVLAFVLQDASAKGEASSVRPDRLIGERLDRLFRRLKRDAGRFDRLDEASRHRVRKRLKRLRYLAEMVRPLYRGVGRFLERLEPAQDALGDCMDLQVAAGLARERAATGHAGAWFNAGWIEASLPEAIHDAQAALERAARAPPFWRDGMR